MKSILLSIILFSVVLSAEPPNDFSYNINCMGIPLHKFALIMKNDTILAIKFYKVNSKSAFYEMHIFKKDITDSNKILTEFGKFNNKYFGIGRLSFDLGNTNYRNYGFKLFWSYPTYIYDDNQDLQNNDKPYSVFGTNKSSYNELLKIGKILNWYQFKKGA
jgi:hypothetical protein